MKKLLLALSPLFLLVPAQAQGLPDGPNKQLFENTCGGCHGADVVIGSRMSGAESEMPAMRRVGNVLFAGLITLLGDQRVRDSASGMRVIRRERLASLYPLPNGLNFTPIMSLRAIQEGLSLVEVPIPYRERVGRSVPLAR